MSVFYPNSGTLEIASGVQTMLALSKLRLFKSTLSPGVTTTKAQLLAEEADFTGYPAGGETVTAFLSPGLYPLGGASISAPTEQFATTDPTIVGNLIGGWWLENAGGDVIAIGTFPSPVPMQTPFQILPITITLVFGTGI